ncbi:HEPN domain-containing protein [Tunicatimonas pelagia]|uniref:HEPN domain-containing protein n=1 Tax=Tunicatimonas pelagia TaxID=931531 RepID=UPI0026662906|nr:HEPN domain-containing protein [Tunicatimonas pelagia]WKN44349.1 HEPN domain-containing protein [Tunicatimonas pelagia]
MQSFRTEIENPVVERDIIDLERKIRLFQEGKIDDDRFRSLRLARGVYGQRQPGVQMVRIKLPFGRVTPKQLLRIADVSDEYASGNLHLTTRQDIQIHYVSLDRTPELWAQLEKDKITLREACGNTVRNITASPKAGIDPEEPFDVSPYAEEMFTYFLRNPVCQEMGRKFKIAFSSSEKDSAFTFIHDIGAIPKVRTVDEKEERGFKIMLGGGLGAQPHLAQVAHEFLPEDQLIPFTEAVLRVFDRHGERNKRGKARMKFLLQSLGLEALMKLVEEEWAALKVKSYSVDTTQVPEHQLAEDINLVDAKIQDEAAYALWKATNVFEQKQAGFYGVFIKVPLGDISTSTARKLATIIDWLASDDIRITINQGLLLRYVRPEALPALYTSLKGLDLADPGFDSVADITACPGTDTCNLGISNSTGVSSALEKVIYEEYPDLVKNQDIKIKISGCPNSCGQHGIASIGFHGSSLKDKQKRVVPALQVLLGGGVDGNGQGRVAEKLLKTPSKRAPQLLRTLFDDYEENQLDGEYYADYYQRQGKMYFYHLLKPLTELDEVANDEYFDWGHAQENFKVEAGVGECAGVIIDLVATLFYEAEEKLGWAKENFQEQHYADAIYHAYNSFVVGAKALLLSNDVKTNTQMSIIRLFGEHFGQHPLLELSDSFENTVLQLNKVEPSADFAKEYLQQAQDFLEKVQQVRQEQLTVSAS